MALNTNKGDVMNSLYFQLSSLMLGWILFFAPILSVTAVESNPSKNSLERLIKGNERYVSSNTVCHEDWSAKRAALVENQNPFAVIVACSDSRVPPEIIFDQTLGSLFIVRIAGNVVDDFAVGSVEYGVNVLGADLVLILGHSNCGAVDAALKGMKFDNHIQEVVNAIQPALVGIKGDSGDQLEKATKANVQNVKEKLKTSTPVLSKLLESGKLQILGGYYHLDSGKVEFLDKN